MRILPISLGLHLSLGFRYSGLSRRNLPLSPLFSSYKSNQEFVDTIRANIHGAKSTDIADILDEIDFRVNSFDFVTLCECLLTLINSETKRNDRLHNLISETFNALERSTIKDRQNFGVTPQAIANLLNALIRSGYTWEQIHSNSRETLTKHIQDILSNMGSPFSVISEISWCLGKLKYSPDSTTFQLLVKIPETHTVTDVGVSKLVHGFFLLGINWNQLSKASKRNLIIAGVASMRDMNDYSLSNYLYALAKMGAPWSAFDAVQLEQLFVHLKRVVPLMNDVVLSNVLWSLGRLGCRANTIPYHILKTIYHRINELSPLGPPTFASTVFSLNMMGIQYQNLPNITVIDMESCFGIYVNPSEISVSTLIYGLGCMGFKLSGASSSVQNILFSAIHGILPNITVQGLANIMYGLAKMVDVDVSNGNMGGVFIEIIDAIRVMIPKFVSSQGLSNTIWSLGQLCSRHDRISRITAANGPLLDSIYEAIGRHTGKMNEQAFSNIMSGLAKVNCSC